MTAKTKDILDATKATILALSLTGIDDANVEIRKVASDVGLTMPGIVIVFLRRVPNKTGVTHFVDWVYHVMVAMLVADNHDLTENETYDGWMESINNAFHEQRLDGVSTAYRCEVAPSDSVDRQAWDAQKLVGVTILRFISREPRGT